MPEDNQMPFEDQDLTLKIIQNTIQLIMNEVLSLDDIMNDTKKARLFEMVAYFLNQAGIALTEVFPSEIADAYTAGHNLGADLLAEAGFQEVQGNLTSQVHVAAVQEAAVQGVNDMQAALRTAGAMFITDIGGILENVQTDIGRGLLAGDATRTITQRVQAEFLKNGMTAFITSDNKRLPLDFYAMTVTRTKVRQAHTQGAANRYKENGVDLVRFPIRSHTCHVCGAREKLVISLTGETEGYPTAEDIGGLPPFHPNCRHYPIPVTDRSQYPPKPFTGRDMRTAESKATYKNEQDIRRKANDEKKLYMKMKAEADAAGETFPSIGTWRRMRRKNDQKWKDLQQKYKDSVQALPTPRQTVRPPRGNQDIIQQAQSQIRAIHEAIQRPPQAAARVPDMQPFGKDIKKGYSEDMEIYTVNGTRYRLDRTPTPRTSANIEAVTEVKSRQELQALKQQIEDRGEMNFDIKQVISKTDKVYARLESLYQTDFNIAFNRKEATKLGEGLNSFGRDMTAEEENAILNYTGSQSYAINNYYRFNQSDNEGVIENSKHLDRLLSENTIQKDVTVFRGAGFNAVGDQMEEDLKNGNFSKYIGATITDKGYMSTSLSATNSFDGDVGFQIMLPQGSKGMYIEKYTATTGEHEVLLPRGTEMRIKEIKQAETGFEFLMELVNNGE